MCYNCFSIDLDLSCSGENNDTPLNETQEITPEALKIMWFRTYRKDFLMVKEKITTTERDISFCGAVANYETSHSNN